MTSSAAQSTRASSPGFRILRAIAYTILWFVLLLLTIWAVAALYVDIRIGMLRIPMVVIYVLAVAAILRVFKLGLKAATLCLGCFFIVLVWWLSLKPTNTADWQGNVDRTAWTEINGDTVTIHNLRNCDYQTEDKYSNCWSDKTVSLSQIRGADLFFTTWGVPYIGHPIVSFQFGEKDHIAFSIEVRYKVGQSYSAILGFFRQFELIFTTAEEGDVIRLRTNFRKDEEVYLYRLNITPQQARDIFLLYVGYENKLKNEPEWYNAVTRNCTTTLDRQIAADLSHPQPWNYQLLLNGTLDALLYQRNRLVTGGLPFPELKEREHIDAAARAAGNSPDYSELIRVGRVGF
jgi:Domain of unknown function (DUF4105)